jgi:hypothetical protein
MNTDFKIKKSVPIRSIRAHPCSIPIRADPFHPCSSVFYSDPCRSVPSVFIRVLFRSVFYSYIPAFASASRTRSGVISLSARSRASVSTCICIWRLAEMRGI